MSVAIDGAPSEKFEPVIAEALAGFSAQTDGRVSFDPEAVRLYQPEGQARPASQPTDVLHMDEAVASLTVVAFAPYDGTGYASDGTIWANVGHHMAGMKLMPKPLEAAQAVHGDVHLALAGFKNERGGFNPRLFAGSLSLFGPGPGDREATEIGYLGQNNVDFSRAMKGEATPLPTATITVAPERLAFDYSTPGDDWARDLRAAYNRYPGTHQIAGFLKLYRSENGEIGSGQARLLQLLNAGEPAQGRLA